MTKERDLFHRVLAEHEADSGQRLQFPGIKSCAFQTNSARRAILPRWQPPTTADTPLEIRANRTGILAFQIVQGSGSVLDPYNRYEAFALLDAFA